MNIIINSLLGFLALVLYQTIAKKFNLPLLSNGLNILLNKAIAFWQRLGVLASKWLNIYDWLDNLKTLLENLWRFLKDYLWRFLKDIWQFILDHVWNNIRPFLESIAEIVSPIWKLIFSPIYFFVGFAKNHYVFFSYLGCGILIAIIAYFTKSYWSKIHINPKYVVLALITIVIGVILAYPTIMPQLFPRTAKFMEDMTRNPDDQIVNVNGRNYA